MRTSLSIALALLAAGAGSRAGEPWWRVPTPIASVRAGAPDLETIAPGAARGIGVFGWYGFWFLDEQERAGHMKAGFERCARAGVKRVVYYDVGEVGDHAAFFDPDGRMVHTGWSLPWWDGKRALTARWFGLDAFMRDVAWAPYPSARAYGLKPFTAPGGAPVDDLYAVLARRGLGGAWSYDWSSNARITDDMAARSGLSALAERQVGPEDTQGKTGWRTVRLVDVDYANPQMRDYVCREIERIIARLRPDGIHADNLGDTNLGHANICAFGLWSLHGFREFLRSRLGAAELEGMGVGDVATFDLPAYIRERSFESRGKRWHILNAKWAEDPVWLAYCVYKMEGALAYHRAFYAAAKGAARREGIDCAVFGNTIPFPLGGSLMRGACDIAHFEWSTVHGHWGMRPMGLPPAGRVGYVTRLGAAISDAPFCWPSIYVSKGMSGAGHENLHRLLAYDCIANRGLLDFGHWYLDGYSPGTPESAGAINRFVRAHAGALGRRRYLADVGLVHSAWSEIASMNVFNPIMERFVDEYSGWCQYLGDTHRQWDVVLQADLSEGRLARYPIVVLPSVLSLSEDEIGVLRRYVAGGGRLVATGETGARHGPERMLRSRGGIPRIDGARGAGEKPGVTYWREDRDAAAARRMGELLAFDGVDPRLETDAPATVGVNASIGEDAAGALLTLDLNNCDIDVGTDEIRPAPACVTTLRLPDGWRGRALDVACARPGPAGESVAVAARAKTDGARGLLRIETPTFDTFLLVQVRGGE